MPSLTCPHCGRTGNTSKALVPGQLVRCPACREPFPAPDSAPDADGPPAEDGGNHETDEDDLTSMLKRARPVPVPAVQTPDPAPVATSRFEYRMLQLPPRITIKEGTPHNRVVAAYLEDVVNRMALEGWDFLRVDMFAITENPGCLSSLLGGRAASVSYYVATFRRPREPV